MSLLYTFRTRYARRGKGKSRAFHPAFLLGMRGKKARGGAAPFGGRVKKGEKKKGGKGADGTRGKLDYQTKTRKKNV